MIALLARLVRLLRQLLTHHEHDEEPMKGSWTKTEPQAPVKSTTRPDIDEAPEHRRHIDHLEAERAATEWTDEQGRKWKRFADGRVGEDITGLDITNVDELRRVYGPAGVIPDEKLVQWAAEAKGSVRDPKRQQEIRDRLAEIEAQGPPEVVDSGYRPVSGPTAGTSPKTGVVLPPAVQNLTTKEWADLKLEQAYGPSAVAMPAGTGYSMRYLNNLVRRAETRQATAYELSILRSRGLV